MVEEGDKCLYCYKGVMVYEKPDDCSCHINPPCEACITNELVCSNCGEGEVHEVKG